MTHFILWFFALTPIAAWAEAPKRGVSVCPLGDCSLKETPIGVSIVPTQSEASSKENKIVPVQQRKQIRSKRSIQKPKAESLGKAASGAESLSGNLPGFYEKRNRADYKTSEAVEIMGPIPGIRLPGLRSGDIVQAVVEQSIKASPSVPTPVRAMVIKGQYKGSFLLGQATLDRELKRVLFDFVKLRRKDTDQVYRVKGHALSMVGQVGLEGHYESQAGKFFVAELGAATAAGIMDATIQRQQTPLGNSIQEPSLANSAKQGAVTALARTADRAAEAARSAPEYTEIDGYQTIQIIFEEDPSEIES